ncbi:MAG: glycosyltransferase, partial [Rhabdochlamydiaceae bacterium]
MRKGVDDLLRAFKEVIKRLPNSRLEIVGNGPELASLQKLTGELGIALNVQFFGKLSGPPLYERYRSCDVFVMPSKTTEVDVEGFGTVFLEAAVFGKPSIGSISGGIPEAIKDGVT